MNIRPLLATGLFVALSLSAATGLEIRSYTPARHDRFTGFPDAPALNPDAWFDAAAYSGVGWSVSDPRRQFVLVSPRHFLFASHWGVVPGESIRFLAPDGTLHDVTVESTAQVSVDGQSTDLSLGRLTGPVAGGVTPHPYLSLPDSGNYIDLPLQVFGANGRVGAGMLTGYNNLDVGTGMSWMSYFEYWAANTGEDDCHFEIGDSGSPSFSLSNGRPALVGTHSVSYTDSANSFYFNYDTFVPNYIPQLDALMAVDGWRMIPSDPVPTVLTVGKTTSPSPLQPSQAGSVTFGVKNSSRDPDGNVRVSVSFPAGTEPTSVSGTGWIADATGPLVWSFHRAALDGRTTAPLTATWDSVPALDSLLVQMTTGSDASADQTLKFSFTQTRSKRSK